MKNIKKLTDEQIERIKAIAKVITIHGYRNSPIEGIHSGISPSSKTGDYSDVKVVTPYGEIPWNEVSRISDEEMKMLNKAIFNQIYTMMYLMETQGVPNFYFQFGLDWDEPELIDTWLINHDI
jgi:hypothetical protein